MISKGTLNHDNFSARASEISSKVAAKAVSENVARNLDTAFEAMQGFLQSESHKKTNEVKYTHTAKSIKEKTK